MEITPAIINEIMEMMVKHRVDRVKLGELELLKTKHEGSKANNNSSSIAVPMSEEELLFYSTTAPALTPEQVEALAVNPPSRKKAKS